ncbi:MAG TPA: polyphosphate polymerase domain-containing protein [Candidatus Gallacutalibacter stercoravium]|nr:polyphosphate polymerase domain-containing protein [Candidatus Gallacutalibacter stercoravium]
MTTKPEPLFQQHPLRHEFKHQINLREDLVLSQRLKKLFLHDKNAGPDGTYRVTSLYFDTPYDGALREKIDGVNRREKFRLRYYGGDLSFIRLEKKFKVNGLCGKRSARITQEQAQRVLCGDFGFLLNCGEPLLIEFYSKLQGKGLRPKTIVRYDREAFLYAPGNVRITLDRNIRTGLGSVDFFNLKNFHLRVLEQSTVLEVKYDAFLPDLVRMAVQVPGRQAAACSKYAACRRFD